MNLISVEELIKKLKEEGVDFGKGDPYNRLRYYTKIGWIPHMTRKKGVNNTNSGHYPIETIETIKKIEKFKEEKLSNEEISEKLKSDKNNFNNLLNPYYEKLKKININFVFFIIILIAFLFESTRSSNQIEEFKNKQNNNQVFSTDMKSGTSFFPEGQRKVFIENKNVSLGSNIIITFHGNITPATFFFISEIKENFGFFIETNLPVQKETKFNWTIIN